jgi:hypothetical protein
MNAPVPRAANLAAFSLPPLPPLPPGGGGGGPPGGTPVDGIAPNLGLAASRRRFRVGRAATPANANATAAAKKARRGTTLKLSLSEPAQVRFVIRQKARGRKVGDRCVKPTRANRKRKRCTRLIGKGRFTRAAPAGRSKVKWSGRIRRRALKRGRYALRGTPTDAAGNRGATRSLSIRIVR